MTEMNYEELYKKKKCNEASCYKTEILRLRNIIEKLSNNNECEDECRTNKLGQKLMKLKSEKEKLENDMEMEQEAIVNRFTKHINHVNAAQTKCINEMEQEEEMVINKLQRQLFQSKKENIQLEKQLENINNYIKSFSQLLLNDKKKY